MIIRNLACLLAIASACSLTSFSAMTQDAPPGTDIWLAKIEAKAKQQSGQNITTYSLTDVRNLVNRKGYDNQPYFLPDGTGLLYTSMFKKSDRGYQTDSMKYDFKSKQHINLTNTEAVSEYSPLSMPDKQHFSAVVVEPDGVQRLWQYPLKSGDSKLINQHIKPVGYHAWGSKQDLTMFVLGQPHTLQYASEARKVTKAQEVDGNIGRSIRYNASRDAFTYIKEDGDKRILMEFLVTPDTATQQPAFEPEMLAVLPQGSDYFTWMNEKVALSASGTEIYWWHRDRLGWNKLADLSQECKTKISRLAVSADASQLAFVCDEK